MLMAMDIVEKLHFKEPLMETDHQLSTILLKIAIKIFLDLIR